MSAKALIYLYCDPHEEAGLSPMPFTSDVRPTYSVERQRKAAKAEGWHCRARRDICPDCWRRGRR